MLLTTDKQINQSVQQLSSDLFTFSNNTFVAEISKLPSGSVFNRLYNDAEDRGFVVASRTGNAVVFVLSSVDENEGDIAGWRFKPVAAPTHLQSLQVLIIND